MALLCRNVSYIQQCISMCRQVPFYAVSFCAVLFYHDVAYTICSHTYLLEKASRKWCHCQAIMYINWVWWWVAFLTNMNKKHKIQVNTQCKTICIDEKLYVISHFEKDEWTVDIWHNVRLPHSSICTIHDKADRITKSAESGTKMFLCAARLPQS